MKEQTVLDPFCGSGSVLVEALILGRNVIGIDINPLAIMLARAKTTPIQPSELASIVDEVLENIRHRILRNREDKYEPSIFYFKPQNQTKCTRASFISNSKVWIPELVF